MWNTFCMRYGCTVHEIKMRSPRTYRLFPLVLLIGILLPSALAETSKARKKRHPAPKKAVAQKLKAAEGQYAFFSRAGELLPDFEEPWTLTKTPVGYDLVEQWKAKNPEDHSRVVATVDFKVSFAPVMQPLNIRIGNKESPSGIYCSLSLAEFSCTGAEKTTKLNVESPYNFFLPSPWLMSAIVRRATKEVGTFTDVRMAYLAGMSTEGPKLETFKAQVLYKGQESIHTAGQIFLADKYEVQNPGQFPDMKIWVSAEGVTLAMEDSSTPDQRMMLMRYKKYLDFSK